jgi:hypothetical protein
MEVLPGGYCLSRSAVVVALVGGWTLIGCGGQLSPTGGDADFQARRSMSTLASFYGDYVSAHGAPPKDEASFRAFLDERAAGIKRIGFESIDQLLTSPRDGEPLVVIYGTVKAPADSPNTPWAAYERTGVEGKRMAARVRGDVVELTDAEIEKEFSGAARN